MKGLRLGCMMGQSSLGYWTEVAFKKTRPSTLDQQSQRIAMEKEMNITDSD
jgi:hypothetical protein